MRPEAPVPIYGERAGESDAPEWLIPGPPLANNVPGWESLRESRLSSQLGKHTTHPREQLGRLFEKIQGKNSELGLPCLAREMTLCVG